jgi:hypothetical protein
MSGGVYTNWRVLGATGFAVVLIIGTYIFVHGVGAPPAAEAADATALLQTLATRDSDHDGLPDWEEALYGTDPHNPDTFHLGMTDGEAVARGLIVPKAITDLPPAATSSESAANSLPGAPADGTLTAAFAQDFFSLYTAAKQANGGQPLTASDTAAIAYQATQQLAQSVKPAPDYKQLSDLTVSGQGPAALRTFAAAAQAVMEHATTTATLSEIDYLKEALTSPDQATIANAYAQMHSIAQAYRTTAVGLAVLPVPTELAESDLGLINSLMHLSQIISDLTRADSDPLTAMLALNQYLDQTVSLGNAFSGIDETYTKEQVTFAPGDPGAAFVGVKAYVIAHDLPPSTTTPLQQ